MDRVIEFLLYGLSLGGLYVLTAIGFTLVYGILNLVNFAHGEMYMLGAYLAVFATTTLRLNLAAALGLAALGAAAVGALTERVAFRPFRKTSELNGMIASLGVSLVLQHLAVLIFSAQPIMLRVPTTDIVFRIGGASLNAQRLVILAASGALIGGLYWLIEKTAIGRAIRACAQDFEMARLMGIDTNRVIMLTFALGAATAGVAGALIAPLFMLDPFVGIRALLKAFVVVVVGGFGNVWGSIAGGLLLGLAETFVITFISSRWVDGIVFAVIIVALILRPTGLLAERTGSRV